MFYFLSKFLPLLVYPLGLILIFTIVILVLKNKEKLQRILLIAVLVVLVLSGNRWIATALARSLEWQYLTPETEQVAEVAVLLGGCTEPQEPPRSEIGLNSASDRLLKAALLYHSGQVEYLLLTGGGDSPWLEELNLSQAEQMKEVLIQLGVPEDKMWIESESLNTYENALYSKEILDEKGISEIVLVTSAMHMPRSVGLFEKQDLTVIPAPTDFSVTEQYWDNVFSFNVESALINLIPNTSSMKTITNVMKEYIGILIYRFRGWL